jgi:hypothetical protein
MVGCILDGLTSKVLHTQALPTPGKLCRGLFADCWQGHKKVAPTVFSGRIVSFKEKLEFFEESRWFQLNGAKKAFFMQF